jgi:hypothetical protein
MTIKDALMDAVTTMKYGTITVKSISPNKFDLGQIQ